MVFIAVVSWWYKLHYRVKKEVFILFHQTRNNSKINKDDDGIWTVGWFASLIINKDVLPLSKLFFISLCCQYEL